MREILNLLLIQSKIFRIKPFKSAVKSGFFVLECLNGNMNTEVKNSIFTLLYAMVLIDRRVVKVEMVAFFANIEELLGKYEGVKSLRAKDVISTWFMQNYKIVLNEMKTPNKTDYMLAHAEKLKDYSHRYEVFDIMNIIAHADENFHDEERKFLDEVAQIWGIESENHLPFHET